MGPNVFQIVPLGLLGVIQIPAQLQIHPIISRHAEEARQPQSRARGYAPSPVDNFVNSLIGDVDLVRQFTLRDAHRRQELFEEHFAGVGWWSVCRYANHFSTPAGCLVIVHDFNFVRAAAGPDETYPILVIDANAVLPFPAACQRFQPIAGRNPQFVERGCRVELVKFSSGDSPKRLWASFPRVSGIFSVKDSVRALAFEGDDHTDHDSMEVMLSQSCAPGD